MRSITYIFFLLLGSFSLLVPTLAQGKDLVARVGKQGITRGQLNLEADWIRQQSYHARDDKASVHKRNQQALTRLIERRLLFVAASLGGKVNCTSSDIQKRITELVNKAGGADILAGRLQPYNLSLADYRLAVCQQIVGDKLLTSLKDQGEPDELEIASYFKDNPNRFVQPQAAKIKLIYKPVIPGSIEADRSDLIEAEMKQAGRRWQSGKITDPAALAAELGAKYSDLGVVHEGAPIPAMNDAVFGHTTVGVLPVVRNKYGFYLIKVSQRVQSHRLGFAEARDMIRKQLRKKKIEEAKRNLLLRMRKVAPAVILDKSLVLEEGASH